jgi:hypothetical protein
MLNKGIKNFVSIVSFFILWLPIHGYAGLAGSFQEGVDASNSILQSRLTNQMLRQQIIQLKLQNQLMQQKLAMQKAENKTYKQKKNYEE